MLHIGRLNGRVKTTKVLDKGQCVPPSTTVGEVLTHTGWEIVNSNALPNNLVKLASEFAQQRLNKYNTEAKFNEHYYITNVE